MAGSCSVPSSLTRTAPSDPSVTMATPQPCARSAAPAAAASAGVDTAMPVIAAASCSFTTRKSIDRISSGRSSTGGVALRMVWAPAALARCNASSTASMGISSCARTTRAESIRTRWWSMWAGLTTQFAPGTTTMWFSPSSATAMSARPVSAPTRSTPCVSMPSSERTPSRWVPALSWPTMPTKAVLRSRAGRGDGLVQPLPARHDQELVAEHRLTGARAAAAPEPPCPG